MDQSTLQSRLLLLVLLAPAFISALTVHEFAHAWAAWKLGDNTAKDMGRLDLDPLVHLDFWGTAMMVLAIISGWPLIGWAKPVPVNPNNFQNRRRDDVLVAIAGPISNIIQAFLWLVFLAIFFLILHFAGISYSSVGIIHILGRDISSASWIPIVTTIVTYGVVINIILAAFNMIPIPPLDGHWVLMGLDIEPINRFFEIIRPFSFFIIFALVLFPPFNEYFFQYLSWFVGFAQHLVVWVTIKFMG